MTILTLNDLWEAFVAFVSSPLGLMVIGISVAGAVTDRLLPRRRRRRASRPASARRTQAHQNELVQDEGLEDLSDLSPEGFEHFVATLFRRRGYKARVVGGEGDHGVDIVVTNPQGDRELVQCKQWNKKWLGEGVVRDFYGAFVHDGRAARGYIVTTSFFSRAARKWAEGKPIDLVDKNKLAEAVEVLGRAA